MKLEIGQQLDAEQLREFFRPVDGTVNFYYGKIGNGKTYAATADILDYLRRGHIVWANWKIDFPEFDQRNSLPHTLMHFIFFKKQYFRYPPENLRYIDPDNINIEELGKIANAHIFLDEGQWTLNSYEGNKINIDKRKLVLHTRHYNRSLNIISQRTQAIHVTARGQVNRFYKCEKKLSRPWLIFKRTEFQDMKEDDVDETKPIAVKVYFASKYIMKAYDTHAMRGKDVNEQVPKFEVYELNFKERAYALYNSVATAFRRSEASPQKQKIPLNKAIPKQN